ncbi:hypothetical protein HDU86_002744 [Geranomyces michiganensis]|nr:hypothetical protein HDU86_002744 [Geranomyces michiganensis]
MRGLASPSAASLLCVHAAFRLHITGLARIRAGSLSCATLTTTTSAQATTTPHTERYSSYHNPPDQRHRPQHQQHVFSTDGTEQSSSQPGSRWQSLADDTSPLSKAIESLPTLERWTVRPARRPITGATDMSGSSIAEFHDALRAHDVRRAWKVYKEMYRRNVLPQLHADDHTVMLGWLTAHTLPRLAALHASRVMENMRRGGHQPDIRDYHAMILCHLRNRDPRRCIEVFRRMLDEGKVEPDVRTYTLAIAAFGLAGDFRSIRSLWRQMGEKIPGARTNMDAWAVTIDALGASGKLADAEQMYAKVREGLGPDRPVDRKVLEAMIKAYGSALKLAPAMKIFSEVKEGKAATPIDVETYDAIIRACVASGDDEMATELWDELKTFCATTSHTVQPSPTCPASKPLASSYNSMLESCVRGKNPARAEQLFEALSASYPPSGTSYEHLVRVQLDAGYVTAACARFDELIGRGHMPSAQLVADVHKARREQGPA